MQKNININCISPGFIKTEMTDQINDEFKKISNKQNTLWETRIG